MKPDEWNSWTDNERYSFAKKLLNSPRGLVLMNEALTTAAAVSRNVDAESNAQDLELLRDTLFPIDMSNVEFRYVSANEIESEDDLV